MAFLTQAEIKGALTRLGELALVEGEQIELLLVGGGVMVREFDLRQSTRDLDIVIMRPVERAILRRLAEAVATERNWTADWLNDAVKGFVFGVSEPVEIFSAPGIRVKRPALEQLLAMKLSAWRDDVDISDAAKLLGTLSGTKQQIWARLAPYLQPGRELKAKYALDDLWEAMHYDA